MQFKVATHVQYAHVGQVPTLAQITQCYGENATIAVLCFQLEDLNNFTGTKIKLEVKQQKEVAQIIMAEFYFFKISEILLFFFRMKSGNYGSFYGSIDAIQLMVALRSFMSERQVVLEHYESECRRLRQEEAYERNRSNCVPYEKYLEMKEKKEAQQKAEQEKLEQEQQQPQLQAEKEEEVKQPLKTD